MELYTLVTGAIALLVIQFLKGNPWPDAAKVLLTIVVSVVLAAIQWGIQRPIDEFTTLTWQVLLANSAQVMAIAVILFKTYFQNNSLMVRLGNFPAAN